MRSNLLFARAYLFSESYHTVTLLYALCMMSMATGMERGQEGEVPRK